MGQDLIHVNPPKLEDYSSEDASDDDDDEARPLTRDELKAKTLNRMYRKGNRASATKKGRNEMNRGSRVVSLHTHIKRNKGL